MYIKDGENRDYLTGKNYLYCANDLVYGTTKEDIINNPSKMSHTPNYPILHAFGWIGKELDENSVGWDNENEKLLVTVALREHHSSDFCLDACCGFHVCEMCYEKHGAITRTIEGSSFNGSLKIKYNGKVYLAPYGVEHYIECHDYRPSEEVIDAILYGEYVTHKMQREDCFILHSEEIYARVEEIKENQRKDQEERQKRIKEVQSPDFQNRLKKIMAKAMKPEITDETIDYVKEFSRQCEEKEKMMSALRDFFQTYYINSSVKDEDIEKFLEEKEKDRDNDVVRKMNRELYKQTNSTAPTPERASENTAPIEDNLLSELFRFVENKGKENG